MREPGAEMGGGTPSGPASESEAGPAQPLVSTCVTIVGATLAAQLLSLWLGRMNPERSFSSIWLPSVLALIAVTLPLAALGIILGRRVGLGAPLLAAMLTRQPGSFGKLRRDTIVAALLGAVMGALLLGLRALLDPYLPSELPAFGHRGVLGGLAVSFGAAIGEEVWFRLGLMTLLVSPIAWLLEDREIRPAVAWPVIELTSVGFGAAHLPQLVSYGAGSSFAVVGTLLGNSLVGILYGWCYWRRSLLAAIGAHFSADVVLHVLPALLG